MDLLLYERPNNAANVFEKKAFWFRNFFASQIVQRFCFVHRQHVSKRLCVLHLIYLCFYVQLIIEVVLKFIDRILSTNCNLPFAITSWIDHYNVVTRSTACFRTASFPLTQKAMEDYAQVRPETYLRKCWLLIRLGASQWTKLCNILISKSGKIS